MVEKLKGQIIDGRWKFVGYVNNGSTLYEFENIYNGEKTKLSNRQVKQILNGETTIAQIQSRRLRNQNRKHNPVWWTNNVNRQFAKQVRKYNKQDEQVLFFFGIFSEFFIRQEPCYQLT